MATSQPTEPCGHCAKPLTLQAGRRCSRCKSVLYCDSTCQLADWKKHKPTCTAKAAELSGSGGNFRPSTSGGDTALRRASLPQQPDEQGSSVPLTSQGASAGAKAKASAASAVSAAAAKNINDDDEDDKDKTAMLKGMGFVAVAAAAVIGGILWLRRK